MIAPAVASAGSLRTGGELGRVRSQQKGVVRTNCVDCLDRTNVVQALLGRRALESLLSDLLLMDSGSTIAASFPQVRARFRAIQRRRLSPSRTATCPHACGVEPCTTFMYARRACPIYSLCPHVIRYPHNVCDASTITCHDHPRGPPTSPLAHAPLYSLRCW